jgi:hypothetical protein
MFEVINIIVVFRDLERAEKSTYPLGFKGSEGTVERDTVHIRKDAKDRSRTCKS